MISPDSDHADRKECCIDAGIPEGGGRLPRPLERPGSLPCPIPHPGRPGHPGAGASLPLLWEGGLGGRHRRPALRGKPAALRQQGDGQERPRGEPGSGLRPSRLERLLPREHGRRRAHRHGYLRGRRGPLPPRPHHPLRGKRRLRRAGRDQHGEKRGPGRAPRRPGLPPGHRRPRLPAGGHPPRRPLSRHHELRLRRDPGAQRGPDLPLRGHRHAPHRRGGAHPPPLRGVPDPRKEVPPAVRRPLPGPAEKVRERRGLLQGSGPPGPAGRPAPHPERRGPRHGAGHGHQQQGLRRLRAGAHPGCHHRPDPR